MADQTVTLRIHADAKGLITGVELAKRETRSLGDEGERAGRKLGGGMAAARAELERTGHLVNQMKGFVLGLGAAVASIQTLKALGGMPDTWSDLTARVRLSIKEHESASDVMARLADISRQTYSSMELTAESYTRNATTLNALNKSTAQQLDYAQALNNALVVSGAKQERAVMVQNSLAKAMAEGALRGEEMNNVLSYGSRIAELLAEELGVNVTELRALSAEGKITGDVIFNSLVKNMQTLTDEAESMPATIEDAFVLLRNSVLQAVGVWDQQNKNSETFAEKLITIADHMGEVMRAAGLLAQVLLTVYGTRLLMSAAAYTTELTRQIVLHLAAGSAAREMGIKVDQSISASIKKIGLLNLAIGTVGAAIAGWQIGTYLREEFVEVERFGIAMVAGLLKAWERLKVFGVGAWETIKAAALGAVEAVRKAAADVVGALAKVNEATDPFGIKSGITDRLRELETQLRPTATSSESLAEIWKRLRAELEQSELAIDEQMFALWESAGAAKGAKDETEELDETLTNFNATLDTTTGKLVDLYTEVQRIEDVTGDVDAMLRSLTRTLADDATRAQMDYQDNLAAILDLEMQWMALGPLSEEQIAKLNEARAMAGELYRRDIEALNDETLRSAERAAEESTRAWERFSYGLADAVLDGSQGVKRWWKRMLDDMKRQLIQSGLLRLFGSLFNTGGGAGGFASMFGGMLGGGQAGGGFLGQLGNMFSGPAMNAAGSNFGAGIAQAAPWLAAAGGALYGYNQSGNIAGAIGYGALGYAAASVGGMALLAGGTAAAAGGTAAAVGTATMSGAMAGAAAVPVIGWVIAAIAALDMITGGKVFGTSHRPESSTSALNIGADGGFATASLTEVRQRSLFRGRSWRTTEQQASDEAIAAAEEFYASIYAAMSGAARALAADVPPVIDAAIRTVTEYDKKGRVTGITVSADVLGRTWSETIDDHEDEAQVQAAAQRAAMRIQAEAIIATIDAALGTTVQQAIGQALPGPIVGGVGDALDRVGRMIDAQIEDSIGGMGWAGPATGGAGGTMGEASAIAERWRHDAELLAAGAQFLLAAATDIRRGAGLLGEEGGLTAITALIEDLQGPSESLVDTYVRVATSAALLDQALALSGVQIDGTREYIVRLATDITTAAGGLERASALWGNYFDRFYTGIERGEYVLAQAQSSAAKEFGDIGLDYTQFVGEGGTQAFRELFESVLPTLSAEAIVEWLEAAAALGIVIDATAALNAELGEAAIAVSQTSEQLAAVNDILAGNAWELALSGMTEAEAAIARINQKYDEQRKELLANAATLEQLAELEGQRQQALAQQAEAAQRQIDDILGGLQTDIDSLGMSEYEREVANIHKQRADYIAALVETGMSLADATIATRAWRDAMLEAAEAAEAARQQRLLDRRSDILGGLQTDIDRLGMTDYEIAVADVHAKRQDHIAALVDTGMSLADATIATREWRDAMLESVRAAEQARILKPLADDLKSMRQQLADFGLSDFARRQAQIARETQDALAAAQAAGATAAELMTISLNGAERAMLAAALAAKGFAAELEGWEFEESLIGLSESEAQLARINKTWEERYLQAVEIFGEGSEEAIRVLGLWDRAVARAADVSTRAMNAINVSGRSIAETMELVQTFYDNLMSKLGHVIGGDPMADWLSELSGLPKLAQQAVRRPLSEVVQLVRNEYLLRAADLNRQIEAAQHQLSILPWDAQAQRRELEHRIGTLHYALGAISDGMGNALDTLKDMYIASLQGVRDYLDSMLLGDLSALTPAERIAEAWDQLTAAVEAGEGDAATRLADTYLRLLREYEASGEDYNAGFYAVRDLLEGMFDIDWDALLGPDAAGATDSDNLAHMAGAVDAQLAAAQVANDWLAQIAANTGGGWGLPSYDVGTYNVPQTGPAILHAGEMVLPRPMADAMRQGAFGGGGDTKALEAKLDGVIQRLDKLDRTTAAGAQQVAATVAKTGEISDRNADASRARHAQAQRRGVTA